jgi:hypothetical protein
VSSICTSSYCSAAAAAAAAAAAEAKAHFKEYRALVRQVKYTTFE